METTNLTLNPEPLLRYASTGICFIATAMLFERKLQ